MTITPSKLRANIYRVLDEVAETGAPVEIIRKGIVLRIVAVAPPSKLSRLKKRTAFVGDPDDIFKIDWRNEWTELK
jgi:antitoxin (DNA-binding transcriptional repressor) of toxin-antitoxin stability system